MPSFNKVILIGHLTRDVELRYTPNNTPIASFGIAINRKWKSADGQAQEKVTFIDVDTWSKTAEFVNKHFKKGDAILVDGRVEMDEWTDKTTQAKRTKIKVVAEQCHFVGGKKSDEVASDARGKPVKQDAPPVDDDTTPF